MVHGSVRGGALELCSLVTIFSSISQRSSIDHLQWEDQKCQLKGQCPGSLLDVLNQRWRVTWGRIEILHF